ncbi:MAG TPA: hypothetical protein VGX68_26650 [Thermoanaerobaculia bacterium]|jgi:hypothetical protein|nr:hypothetical protein [Thermoanaerobaculia bacterium]
MTQRKAQRFAAAVALAGILLLAAAPVHARDLGLAPCSWQRIQDLWMKGVSFLWSWSEPAAPDTSGDLRKEGYGLDPDGSHSAGSTAPAGGNSSLAGKPADPNG